MVNSHEKVILPGGLSCPTMDLASPWGLGPVFRLILLAVALLAIAGSAEGQAGDRKDEIQTPLPPELQLPPAPALSPEEELDTFRLEPGFKIELVASEPLINDPVVAKFDEDGRLWVVEMKGYMPNPDGKGEGVDNGSIVVLEDEDGDGRMDKKTVFLHRLVLPRALGFAPGGVLVLSPPDLLFCQDFDGDGEADEVTRIDTGLGGLANPEHSPNGLLRGMDNWIHLAGHNRRYRFRSGRWEKSRSGGGGQWGISKDDVGRLFFNYNSSPLHADLIPSHYAVRHPGLGKAKGVNFTVLRQGPVWPVHLTPGVNRGYQEGLLKDGRLSRWTAACGPVIYRGTTFPSTYHGNAFICETAGNLVQRCLVEDENGFLRGRIATPDGEFLASTDERFRPVNLVNGPDGNLFVVDFYRGIIQHRMFMTSFLRHQVEDRGLATPLGLGRIWRVSPEDFSPAAPLRLSDAAPEKLVGLLAHPEGWWRDTAQRVLVDRQDFSVIPSLEKMAREGSARGRLHALWTLEGLDSRDPALLLEAMEDPDSAVAAASIRILEPTLASGIPKEFLPVLHRIAEMGPIEVRRQLALSLPYVPFEKARETWIALLKSGAPDAPLRTGAVSGLQGLEVALLGTIGPHPDWQTPPPGGRSLFRELGQCVAATGEEEDLLAILTDFLFAESVPLWQKEDLVAGLIAGLPKGRTFIGTAPPVMGKLAYLEAPSLRTPGGALAGKLKWVPTPETETPEDPQLLAAKNRGRSVFRRTCLNCHQAMGDGMEGLAPPLAGSEWLDRPAAELVRIVTNGLDGPIQVAGRSWNLVMPGVAGLSDEEVADVLTYVKFRWALSPERILPATVEAVR
jgi:glucose/arabinose dehydrogenase/mono/diheme cytochrome c family protein